MARSTVKSLSYQFWLSPADSEMLERLSLRKSEQIGVKLTVSDVFRSLMSAQTERDAGKSSRALDLIYCLATDEEFGRIHHLPERAFTISRSFWLQPEEKVTLDSIALQHGLRSRNEAFRFVIRVAAALDNKSRKRK